MNMKRARFWRNLLLFSALSGAATLPQTHAQEGVSKVGDGSAGPGAAAVPTPDGIGQLSPSPYMPLDPGYNYPRPMPPTLPQTSDSLNNSRRSTFGPRYDIGQFLGNRLGVSGADTNFNFLLPYLMGSENDVLFIDGRGVATQQGQGAASAGIGYRNYDPTLNRIFGLSGWVDYDQGHQRTYQQAGVSFESLGTWMDVRVNGYIPFGRESNIYSSTITGTPFFSGSSLLVNQRQLTESAYHGFDAEMGGPMPLLGRYGVSGYVGGYWLDARTDKAAAGPRVRFEANVTDGMRASVTASNDPVFGTNAWVNLNMTLPDGRPRRWFRPTPVEDRLLWTVNRSYRVQTHSKAEVVPTPVLIAPPGFPNNPQGGPGQPVRVIFVDPDRLTNGNGTLEHPFNTFQGFANSAGNTLIIVDGSAAGKVVTGTVSLFSDQKLLSTGIVAAGGVTLNTNLGVITLPGLPGFGDPIPVSPILQNPAGGTLVTLAGNNTEVAGLTFNGTTSSLAIPHATGIAGSNFSDFNIHHNTFLEYKDAVALNNVHGTGLFQANTLTGTPGVSVDGFRLTNSGVGSLDLFVNAFVPAATGPGSTLPPNANAITGNDNAGINITARNRAVINAHIVGNVISNNGQGIILDASATRSVINASIINNEIDGNRGEDRNKNSILDPGEDVNGDGILNPGNGVLLMANASTLNLAQVGEDVNLNGKLDPTEDKNGNGILDAGEDKNGNGKLDLAEDKNGNGKLDGGFFIARNTITHNTGDGIAVQSINNSIVNMIAVRNNFGNPADYSSGNLGRGMSITADSGTVTANIGFLSNEDTNFNGVLDPGEDKNGNGTLDVANPLDGNNFVANRAGGLFVDLSGNAIGNIVALNNTITGVGSGGLTFQILGANNGTTNGTPFSFINSSVLGNDINGIVWNIAPATLEFNTVGVNATAFGPRNGTDTTTGLTSVNGTTNPFQVTDQATALNLQFATFHPVNGILDPGEDTNNNGKLDPGEDKPLQFDFNVGTSGAGGVPAALTGNNFIGSQITATFSSGQVLSGTLQAIAGNPTASQFVASAGGNNAGTGPGVEMRVSQTAVLTNPTFVGNNIQFNGGAGFTATATDDGQINGLLLKNNVIQNNGTAANGGGISLNTVLANSAQINGSILNNTLSNNIGPGLSVTANSGAINLTQIDSNTLNGNTTGIALSTLNNGTISTRVTNNTMNNSLGDAFIAKADTGVITLNQFSDNTLNSAGGNGIVLTALNGGTIDIPKSEDINGNGTLDAGEDVNNNGFLDLGMRNNLINNPVGNGLFVNGTNGTFNLGTISGLTVNRSVSGVGGIVLDVTNSTTTGTFVGNTLTGGVGNANLGTGFSLTATNGTFDVTIGGPNATDRNLIQSNRGAGIAILAQNTAVGTFNINNNLITGTVDDANVATPFSGQGIYVGTRTSGVLTPATALLNNPTIVNNVIGDAALAALSNAGGGILVEVGQQSTLNGMTIDNNLISHNGPNAPGAFVANSNNVVNGITFVRTTDAVIDNVALSNNTITNNTFDGVYLHAFGGNLDALDFTLRGNTISNNAFDGVNLRTEADAQLNTILTGNKITNNRFNGIEMSSFEAAATDLETQTGVWTKNTISGNGAHGIEVSAVSGISADPILGTPANPLIIGLNGVDPADGLSLGNTITNNGMGGIEINAAGDLELNNNMITGNGAVPTALGFTDTNGTGGVDVNLVGGVGELRARVTNNVIADNTGTGFEVVTTTGQRSSLTLLGNLINHNTGRGIDLLNRADGTTNAQIGDGTLAGGNSVTNNGLEGIYIVNTASATQSQTGNVLVADGSVFARPNMVLDIRGNSITGNNNNGTNPGGGLVLLVGTSNSGGFDFGPGSTTGNFGFNGNAVGTNSGLNGNGRVNARITDNVFSGQLGDDVRIETFVSTVNPIASAGTWTAAQFNVTAFERDPLARLNLAFHGNTGNSISVNNANAVYTNAEAVFKSRLNTATPPGPFFSGVRPRNANRVADRGLLGPIVSPDFGTFAYDGVGASTLRLESDFDSSGFSSGGFSPDTFTPPASTTFPFGVWGTAAPGTFSFPATLFP